MPEGSRAARCQSSAQAKRARAATPSSKALGEPGSPPNEKIEEVPFTRPNGDTGTGGASGVALCRYTGAVELFLGAA